MRSLGLYVGSAAVLGLSVFLQSRPDLIQALTAGGTLLAAGYTAIAATAARHAAEDSSTTAQRAREALARTIKPSVGATIFPGEDRTTARGSVSVGGDRGALEVQVTWLMRDGRRVVNKLGDLIPEPTGVNAHLPVTVDLGPWAGSAAATAAKATIDYTDSSRLMRWRLTKQFFSEEEWRQQGYEPNPNFDDMTYDEENPLL